MKKNKAKEQFAVPHFCSCLNEAYLIISPFSKRHQRQYNDYKERKSSKLNFDVIWKRTKKISFTMKSTFTHSDYCISFTNLQILFLLSR